MAINNDDNNNRKKTKNKNKKRESFLVKKKLTKLKRMQKFQAQLEPNVFHRFLVSDASVMT